MPKQHTVTTVKEYEYSEDGYLLRETVTVTVTTVEPDDNKPPSAPYPRTPWGRYPVGGGHLVSYKPPVDTMIWNGHGPIPSNMVSP